jgi:hypothetical protein
MTWTPVPEDEVPGPDATLANLTKQSGDPEVGYISPEDVAASIDALLNRVYYAEQAIGVLAGNVDSLLTAMNALNPQVADLEARVQALEGVSQVRTYTYVYASTTTEGANSGQVRLDSSDQHAATKMWASVFDSSGTDYTLVWERSVATAEIYLQDRDDADRWQRYRATGSPPYVVKGNYVEIAVQWLEGGAPLPTGSTLAAAKSTSGAVT